MPPTILQLLAEIQRLRKIVRLQNKIIKKDEETEKNLKEQIKLLQSMVDVSRLNPLDWAAFKETKCH